MKIDAATLIAIAAAAAKSIGDIQQIIALARAKVEQDYPGELAAFDAQVEASRKPTQQAADKARAEEGTSDDKEAT